jgi:hypothetical protein
VCLLAGGVGCMGWGGCWAAAAATWQQQPALSMHSVGMCTKNKVVLYTMGCCSAAGRMCWGCTAAGGLLQAQLLAAWSP